MHPRAPTKKNKYSLSSEFFRLAMSRDAPMSFFTSPFPTWTRVFNDLKCVLGYSQIRGLILQVLQAHRRSDDSVDLTHKSTKDSSQIQTLKDAQEDTHTDLEAWLLHSAIDGFTDAEHMYNCTDSVATRSAHLRFVKKSLEEACVSDSNGWHIRLG